MRITVRDVEVTAEALQKTRRDIQNYSWMANMITKEDAEDFMPSTVAMGGIESTMPKAPYTVGDPTYGAVQRKIRSEERNERYVKQVKRLENAVAGLTDEKERIVIEGCMDDLRLKEIGQLLGVSKQSVYEIKERAIGELAVVMYLKST